MYYCELSEDEPDTNADSYAPKLVRAMEYSQNRIKN